MSINDKKGDIMNTMSEVVEEIKNIISLDIEQKEGKNRKVKDKDVAKYLSVDPLNLASAKFRGKILFKEIAEFCAKKKISINTLLFNQSVESLESNTNKYFMSKYFLLQ